METRVMLAEWLEPLLTACPRHLRQMGCLREMLGIRRRWRRWRWAWQPHCERSQAVIASAIERCDPARRRRKAVVLGSGWLHDVPLDLLASTFREVVLVDLFHPLASRWQVWGRRRRYGNVRLLAADVTGTLEGVWHAAQRPGSPLPEPAAADLFLDDPDLDLTVSLNLLSQLPCLPERHLLAAGSHEPAVVLAFCRSLIESHLSYLSRLPGVVTLVTDTELRTLSVPSGQEESRTSTLYDVPFTYAGERWPWLLVPRRARYPHHAEELQVVGVVDVKTAAQPSSSPS